MSNETLSSQGRAKLAGTMCKWLGFTSKQHINIYLKLIQLKLLSNAVVMYSENHKKHQRTMTFLQCEL